MSSLALYLGNYANIKKLCSQLKIYCDESGNSVQAHTAYKQKLFSICVQTGVYIYIYIYIYIYSVLKLVPKSIHHKIVVQAEIVMQKLP